DEGADAALDAELFVPHGDVDGDVALFVLGGAGGEGAVGGQGGDGDAVAESVDDGTQGVAHEIGRLGAEAGFHPQGAVGAGGDGDFLDVLEGDVDGVVVHGQHLLAGLGVALDNSVLDLAD